MATWERHIRPDARTLPSLRDQYALTVLAKYLKREQESDRFPGRNQLPKVSHPTPTGQKAERNVKVGILGAGAAGVYAAMIINSFNDPRITCEILESSADDPEKKGIGRLWTHYFSPPGFSPSTPPYRYDYFDVGAMRFPDIRFMKCILWLFHDPQSPVSASLKPLIIKYILDDPNNVSLFNNILYTSGTLPPGPDPFQTGVGATEDVSATIGGAIDRFKEPFLNPNTPFTEAWEHMMQYDKYSTRTWMGIAEEGPHYTDPIIRWCETFDSASNLYDQAVTETVMDSIDFEGTDWVCINGGSYQIAEKMIATLHPEQLQRGKKVTKLTVVEQHPTAAVDVYVNYDPTPTTYEHVITTLPFGCLRAVDTTDCDFSWTLQTALRTLNYDASVKVAIQFTERTRWWQTTEPGGNQYVHKGGSSSTDRPTRVVVYPSYGIENNDVGQGSTMIVSYTWSQDAKRIGSFARGPETQSEQDLIKNICHDLELIHGFDTAAAGYKSLYSRVSKYKIHDWYADSNSCGAFALFGPGQFSNLFESVTTPAAGVLHFAGEATSVHHAWVEGALCSAYRTVLEILIHEGYTDLIAKMDHTAPGEYIKWPIPEEVKMELLEPLVAIGQQWKPSAHRRKAAGIKK